MFENENYRNVHTGYYLPKVEIKYCNVIVDGKTFFDQPVNNNCTTSEKIQITAIGQGDDYSIGCLLGYKYLEEHYNTIAVNLSKQQALYVDPKAIQQINFHRELERTEGATMFFIIEDAKETILGF